MNEEDECNEIYIESKGKNNEWRNLSSLNRDL